jgi:predicted nucleic acid-binding protein
MIAAVTGIYGASRLAGRPAATVDLMIAAIAFCRNASIVTRKPAKFEACNVAIVNPWG